MKTNTHPVAYIIATATLAIITGFAAGIHHTPPQHNDIRKALWLIGEWQHQTARGILYERWKQTSNTSLAGKSYYLNNKDTTVLETITIKQDKQNLWYIPTVTGQNNGKAVSFKLTEITIDKMVFENPEHDFPQKITYRRITADSLVAAISGMVNGKLKQQDFPMRRSR